MSRFKSLLTSALFTIISVVSLNLTVLGKINDEFNSHELDPVGGVVTAVNKLAIIAPYLVLAGLIIAVSAIVIKKRK